MPTSARNNLSGDHAGGTNSGNMTLAMNNTVISGTPRTNSINPIDSIRTNGISERRPSAKNNTERQRDDNADRRHNDRHQQRRPTSAVSTN